MSSLLLSTLTASSTQEKLYVDDVFSTYLYTGNGASQTINNGIDLAGKGGLVWIKHRYSYPNNDYHSLYDTIRGVGSRLATNGEWPASPDLNLSSFDSSGFSVAVANNWATNGNNYPLVSWTFRRNLKFFDVATYTGDGTSGRQIAHSLGVQAGFVTVKATSTTGDWNSFHRSATGDLKLNTSDAQTASRAIITAADSSTFTVSGAANTNGVSYVAYLWAHDPSTEGIIQCGSFTTDGSGKATVNLGWEPQYVLTKRSDSSTLGQWLINDTMRGMPTTDTGAGVAYLQAESSNPEAAGGYASPIATGFRHGGGATSATHIYLAIRRPNKPPTTGTQVFTPQIYTGDGTSNRALTGFGFSPDLVIQQTRTSVAMFNSEVADRLRGVNNTGTTTATAMLRTNTAEAEGYSGAMQSDIQLLNMDGITVGPNSFSWSNGSGFQNVLWNFRRAPGFMDVVCYTGTGSATTVAHNLGAEPELMIVKSRSASQAWLVAGSVLPDGGAGSSGYGSINNNNALTLNTTNACSSGDLFSALPSTTSFGASSTNLSVSSRTYVAYLFASLSGISKVGSYTGNGSSQTVDCGFSTGARFFLVKAASTTGNWWVFDSARGIVSSFDPALALNSTAAEITSVDAVDPASVGIIVNQEATCSINASGVNYVYFAIS